MLRPVEVIIDERTGEHISKPEEHLFRLAARNRHRTLNKWRGRPKDNDSGPHHMPAIEHGMFGTDGVLPQRRRAPRGR